MPDPIAPSALEQLLARETWLQHVADQAAFNARLSSILKDAAKQGEKIILRTVGDGIGAETRRSQLKIAIAQLDKISADLWGKKLTPLMMSRIQQSTQRAVDGLMQIDSLLARAVGDTALRNAFLQAGRIGAANVQSRILNEIALSPQVYKTQALSNGWVQKIVNQALALNRSSAEIAKDVKKFIDPDVAGGVSYAAQRLGRTELNNAFHATTIAAAGEQPWVEGFLWNTSGSHPAPDECDDYAAADDFGLGAGVYPADSVPDKPHPQCLCYLTTITTSDDQFIDNLVSGEYDTYLEDNAEE